MDKIRNPFSPGAGSPPPELAGREGILEQARVLFGRVQAKRSEKSLLLTGLRGVGKTVLLNEIERIAVAQGFRTILVEAHEGKPSRSLAALYLPLLVPQVAFLFGLQILLVRAGLDQAVDPGVFLKDAIAKAP